MGGIVVEKAEGTTRPAGLPYRSETLTRQVSRILVSRPDYFGISEVRNPFSRNQVPVDLPLAIRQWEGLCSAFRQAGLEVLQVEPKFGLEDMCFTATQAFVGVDPDERAFAVVSRMLNRSRRDEVQLAARWFSHQGYTIVDLGLEGEEFLEGSSDLIWNPDWQFVWAGYGHRSTAGAVDLFAAAMDEMGFAVHRLELVDPYFYHLNLCLAPLTPDAIVTYPGAFAPQTLATMRRLANVHELPREEALQFVCNGVSVNGYYITPRLTRRLEKILGEEGIEPLVVDVSEFHKAGGSVASLKMLLP